MRCKADDCSPENVNNIHEQNPKGYGQVSKAYEFEWNEGKTSGPASLYGCPKILSEYCGQVFDMSFRDSNKNKWKGKIDGVD